MKISGNPLTYTTRIRAACLPFDYQGVTDTSIQPSPYVTGFGALEDGQPSATKLFQVGNIFDALQQHKCIITVVAILRPKFQSWVTRRAGPPTAGSGTSGSRVITSALAKAMQTPVPETLEVPCSQTGSGTDGKCTRVDKCFRCFLL